MGSRVVVVPPDELVKRVKGQGSTNSRQVTKLYRFSKQTKEYAFLGFNHIFCFQKNKYHNQPFSLLETRERIGKKRASVFVHSGLYPSHLKSRQSPSSSSIIDLGILHHKAITQ